MDSFYSKFYLLYEKSFYLLLSSGSHKSSHYRLSSVLLLSFVFFRSHIGALNTLYCDIKYPFITILAFILVPNNR